MDAGPAAEAPAAATRCPYCAGEVARDVMRWVACERCVAVHHAGCWVERGACAACGAAAPLALPGSHLPAPGERGDPRPPRALEVALVLAIGAAAVALVAVGRQWAGRVRPAAPPPPPAPVVDPVAELVEQLVRGDNRERREAALRVGELGRRAREVVPALLTAADDYAWTASHDGVRLLEVGGLPPEYVVAALLHTGDEAALVKVLVDAQERGVALSEAGRFGGFERAHRPLVVELPERAVVLRIAAARLGARRARAATPAERAEVEVALGPLVRDVEPLVAAAAREALGVGLGPEAPAPPAERGR